MAFGGSEITIMVMWRVQPLAAWIFTTDVPGLVVSPNGWILGFCGGLRLCVGLLTALSCLVTVIGNGGTDVQTISRSFLRRGGLLWGDRRNM